MHRRLELLGMAVLLALLSAACGDDDVTPDDGGREDVRADADADGDGDGDVPDTEPDVEADGEPDVEDTPADDTADAEPDVEPPDEVTFLLRSKLPDGTYLPLEGALGAFFPPDGEPVELETDADGRVTFGGFHWSAGTADVTFYLEGYPMLSAVELEPATIGEIPPVDGAIPLDLDPWTPHPGPDMTVVTGTASGLLDAEAHMVCVFAFNAAGAPSCGPAGAPYEFVVERGTAFTLVAIEVLDGALPSGTGYFVDVFRAAVLEVDALAGETAELDVDLAAHEVALSRVETSMVLPTRPDSPLQSGWPNVWTKDWASGWDNASGWAETVDFNTEHTAFDVTHVWVDAPGLEAPFVQYLVSTRSGEWSQVFLPGFPVAGTLDPPLLDLPRWVAPVGPATRHPLHERLEWEVFDDDIQFSQLYVRAGEVPLWVVVKPGGAPGLTIPSAPSLVDEATFLGVELLSGVLQYGNLTADGRHLLRLANARPVILRP